MKNKATTQDEKKRYIVKLYTLDTIFFSTLFISCFIVSLLWIIMWLFDIVDIGWISFLKVEFIINTVITIFYVPFVIKFFIGRAKVFKMPFEERYNYIKEHKLVRFIINMDSKQKNLFTIGMLAIIGLGGIIIYAGVVAANFFITSLLFVLGGILIAGSVYLLYRCNLKQSNTQNNKKDK